MKIYWWVRFKSERSINYRYSEINDWLITSKQIRLHASWLIAKKIRTFMKWEEYKKKDFHEYLMRSSFLDSSLVAFGIHMLWKGSFMRPSHKMLYQGSKKTQNALSFYKWIIVLHSAAEPRWGLGGPWPLQKKKKFPSNYEEKINGPPQHWTAGPPTHFSTILPVQPQL